MKIVDTKTTIFSCIFGMLIALLSLLSCINGSDLFAGGGIGGTGITIGQIDAFGSVVVNDIRFASDEAGIFVNGQPAAESDLRIGMIVEIKGRVSADKTTGVAENIVYEKDLQGPVSKITVIDGETKELLVLGQTVVISRTQTRFDEPAISFDTVEINNMIEVSGFIDSNSGLRATWITLADSLSEIEIKGTVSNLDEEDKTFIINGSLVDYGNADTSELQGGMPLNGQFVSVKGQSIGQSGELIADDVAPADDQPEVSEGDHLHVAGFITTVRASSEFVIEFELGRWPIGVTDQTQFENGSVGDINPDKSVAVEGTVNAFGFLEAQRIIFRTDYTEDYAKAIAVGPNGNIYVAGYSESQTSDFDFMTIKYDVNGNRLWVRHYDAGYFDEDMATAIAIDTQGNIYVTGYSEADGTDYDFSTIKYDPSGNVLWTKTYDSGIGDTDVATAIALNSTGYVYVTGYSKTNTSDFDYVTIRYDSDGNATFFASHDGSGMEDKARGIAVDQNGNVYVTGHSMTDNDDFDFLTVKYNPSGNVLWSKTYDSGISDIDMATAIALDSSGNAYVAGYAMTDSSDFDYVTVRYDPDGNATFFASYDGAGMEDAAQGIVVDNTGNVYITGSSNHPDTELDYLTIKYDDNGSLLWASRYNNADMDDAAQSIALNNQGKPIVTGYSNGQYSDCDFTTIMYYEPAANSEEIEWIDRYDGSYD